MAKQDQQMQMPGVFGGLMRYDEEYASRFLLSPAQVIGFIIAVIILIVALKVFFPPASPVVDAGSGGGVPAPVNGLILLLLSRWRS